MRSPILRWGLKSQAKQDQGGAHVGGDHPETRTTNTEAAATPKIYSVKGGFPPDYTEAVPSQQHCESQTCRRGRKLSSNAATRTGALHAACGDVGMNVQHTAKAREKAHGSSPEETSSLFGRPPSSRGCMEGGAPEGTGAGGDSRGSRRGAGCHHGAAVGGYSPRRPWGTGWDRQGSAPTGHPCAPHGGVGCPVSLPTQEGTARSHMGITRPAGN